MVRLVPLDRGNWQPFMALRCAPDQVGHAGDPEAILARAYVHRAMGAEAWGIAVDDMAVGLVMWWTWPRGPNEAWLVVDQLLVDQRWQRRGLARWVLNRAGEEARRQGCMALSCCVIAGNSESEGLMAKCGFCRWPDEDSGNELAYVLPLQPPTPHEMA